MPTIVRKMPLTMAAGNYCAVHRFAILCAQAVCDRDARTDRKTDEQVDDQVCDRAGSADCRNGYAAAESAHNDQIGCVEQQLQKTCEDDWNSVKNDV